MTRSPDDPIFVIPRLYAIIDPAQGGGRSPVEMATALLAAAVRLVQLRDKHASSGELYVSALRVGECVRHAGGIFIVNDRADVASRVDADGVHVGQDDLPVDSAHAIVGRGKIVGYSTHNLEQVIGRPSARRRITLRLAPSFPPPAKRIRTRRWDSRASRKRVRPHASPEWPSAE